MNMRKIIGTASCSLMALSLLVQPALAQAPNLGPDWVVVKERKVRNFVPNPDKPGSGTWQLIDVQNRTYFVEDGNVTRKVTSSRKESSEISLGKSDRVYGSEEIQSRVKGEKLVGEVPNSRRAYQQGDYLVSYKLDRYDRFEDLRGYTPWSIYNRYATRTRDVNYYMLEWTDPVTGERLSEILSTPEYTDWLVGAPYDKDVAQTGKDNFARRLDLGDEDRRVVLGKVFSPQMSLSELDSKAASTKVGTFLSNKGQSNSQVALSGSKLRTAMGANSAVASKAKTAQSSSGTVDPGNGTPGDTALLDKILGSWELKGGSESSVSFRRDGKGDDVKVTVHLTGRGVDFEHEFKTKFDKAMLLTHGKRTVGLTFNDDGTELSLKFGSIDVTLVKDTGERDEGRDGRRGRGD